MLSPIVETAASYCRVLDYSAVGAECANSPAKARAKFGKGGYSAKMGMGSTAICMAGTIPDDVKAQAAMYAPQLVATMRENVRRMARHQTVGSLDTSKLVRLAHPTSAAQFERDAAVAFRARTIRPVEAPLKIAVVADMNWRIRSADKDYVNRVGTLTFILSDAAACAGLQCGAYGVRGHLNTDGPRNLFPGRAERAKPCALLSKLADYGKRVVPSDFAFHADHYGYVAPFRYVLQSAMGSGSRNGTGGPSYAREHDGATFVVGLGEFDDAAACDVVLPASMSLADAVATVHAALQARQRRAAA